MYTSKGDTYCVDRREHAFGQVPNVEDGLDPVRDMLVFQRGALRLPRRRAARHTDATSKALGTLAAAVVMIMVVMMVMVVMTPAWIDVRKAGAVVVDVGEAATTSTVAVVIVRAAAGGDVLRNGLCSGGSARGENTRQQEAPRHAT